MIDVESYLELGFRGIVILDSEWREEASGYQHEHTTEQVVCVDREGQPHRMTVSWTEKLFPRHSKAHNILSSEQLSRDEYERIVSSKGGVADTPDRAARLEKRRSGAAAAERALDQARPACPTCSLPMVLRNSRDGRRFWGCKRYPSCKGTRSF